MVMVRIRSGLESGCGLGLGLGLGLKVQVVGYLGIYSREGRGDI